MPPRIKPYIAAFILPNATIKTLSDGGWTFESNSYIPDAIEIYLRKSLDLQETEKFEDESIYEDARMKMCVMRNAKSEIHEIYIQLFDASYKILLIRAFNAGNFTQAELFVPSEQTILRNNGS